MSFDVLPKDVVWLILSDVIELVFNGYYATIYRESRFYDTWFGYRLLHEHPMTRQLYDMSRVCKLWRTLLVGCTCSSGYRAYFKFKPGTNRHRINEPL
jgi:hypothetical protein